MHLDGMSQDELMAFWKRYRKGAKLEDCRALIGDSRKGYTRIANDLANYASNKATAIQCRLNGLLRTALSYEAICDRIYDGLPKDVRW